MKSKMTKNKFFKLASLLVMLCLVTTCAISTTFAKYTTGDSGSDTARVAKWGIEVSTSGTLFGKDYKDAIVTADATSATVKASEIAGARDNVVAPGTKNDAGFKMGIKGTPEVAYKVTATTNSTDKNNDIYLANGTYGMMVEAYGINVATDFTAREYFTFDGSKYVKATAFDPSVDYFYLQDKTVIENSNGKYNPIAWTVQFGESGPELRMLSGLENVAPMIADQMAKDTQAPNTPADNAFILKWDWSFDGDDAADTVLGNFIAKKANMVALNPDGTYSAVEYEDDAVYGEVAKVNGAVIASLDIEFNFELTVEQVD